MCTLNLPLMLSGLYHLTYVTRPKQFSYLLIIQKKKNYNVNFSSFLFFCFLFFFCTNPAGMAVTQLLPAGTWRNSKRSLLWTNFHYAFLKTKWWYVFLVHYNCCFGWMCPSFRLPLSCLLRQDAVVCHCASTWGNLTPSLLLWMRRWKSLVV